MILGNSFGKNRGKKYFVRNRDEQNADLLYAEKAEDFNRWFARSHNQLIPALRDKNIYNSDTFNDTYLRIYETILFQGLNVLDYKSYFIRSYYTNYINGSVRENRYCDLLPNFDVSDSDKEFYQELEAKQKLLEQDILNYVYLRYKLREFELFKMYVTLKPAVNYTTLSEITGVMAYTIQRIVSKIKKDIQDNQEFTKRRREVM